MSHSNRKLAKDVHRGANQLRVCRNPSIVGTHGCGNAARINSKNILGGKQYQPKHNAVKFRRGTNSLRNRNSSLPDIHI